MADTGFRRRHRKMPGLRPRAWCCSFAAAPQSPDCRSYAPGHPSSKLPQKPPFAGSPSPSSKLGLGIIDPRRILSPGRVSPIDSDAAFDPLPEGADSASVATVMVESEPECPDPAPGERSLAPARAEREDCVRSRDRSDLRLILKGKDGRILALELDRRVLCDSSSFFAAMVHNSDGKIEVDGVEDVRVVAETVELMYEADAARWLMNAGASRAIDVLEVSSTIMFDRGVASCLRYLEAVPWNESEEEKLKKLFASHTFDEVISQDVLARLSPQGWSSSEALAVQLIQSVTNGTNGNARREMQSLVSGLLCKSSIYQKDAAGLNKESLYQICHSCLNSLVELFEEASDFVSVDQAVRTRESKPLIERVSKQVENLNWLLEILINYQMAEDFVGLWAMQEGLIKMHDQTSPLVRYELSRISASVFVALGKGKLQCQGDIRGSVFRGWFGPLLLDFGWLQRCSKGLDMRMLEDTLGQALLTLPLRQQQSLFEEWLRCFAQKGTECPNLSRAFQVWWRRSFVRSLEPRR